MRKILSNEVRQKLKFTSVRSSKVDVTQLPHHRPEAHRNKLADVPDSQLEELFGKPYQLNGTRYAENHYTWTERLRPGGTGFPISDMPGLWNCFGKSVKGQRYVPP